MKIRTPSITCIFLTTSSGIKKVLTVPVHSKWNEYSNQHWIYITVQEYYINIFLSLVAHGILDLVSKDKHALSKECLGPMSDNLLSRLKEMNNCNDNMTYMDASASTVKSYASALLKDKVNIMAIATISHVIKS